MGISRRGYAKGRGISESAVRKHIASGVLADALLPDGTIDPVVADRLLAESVTRGRAEPVSLRTARARRDRALASRGAFELEALRQSVVSPEYASYTAAAGAALLAEVYRRLPSRAAPRVHGRPAAEVSRLLKAATNTTLGEMHVAALQTVSDVPPDAPPENNFDNLSAVELKAVLANQAAEKLELEHELESGRLVLRHDAMLTTMEPVNVFKSNMLALPGRLDTLIEHAGTVEEVERLLRREVEAALANLCRPLTFN